MEFLNEARPCLAAGPQPGSDRKGFIQKYSVSSRSTTAPTSRTSVGYGIGGLDVLHVTEADFGRTHLEKQTHFAISVDDFDAFVQSLRNKGVTFCDWHGNENLITGRPDGFRQVYVRDPDNYLVEINNHTREKA